jgi:hypothetical protein
VDGHLEVSDNNNLCEDEVDVLAAQLTSLSGWVYNTGNTGTCPSA